MHLLAPLLSNPVVLKVLHGGTSDVAWLQRDAGLFLCNVFDTERACRELGLEARSLGALLRRYCGVEADKAHQRADWRRRPLPPELIEYARGDVHWLLYLADRLGEELVAAGAQEAGRGVGGGGGGGGGAAEGARLDPASPLGRAVQRSQAVALQLYAPPAPGQAAAAAAMALTRAAVRARRGRDGALRVLGGAEAREVEALGDCIFTLCEWRDAEARRVDDGRCSAAPQQQRASARDTRVTSGEPVVQVYSACCPTPCCFTSPSAPPPTRKRSSSPCARRLRRPPLPAPTPAPSSPPPRP